MNIPQINARALQISQLSDATAGDILTSKEAGVFARAFLMMESNLNSQSTQHQLGEIQRVKEILGTLSAQLDARLLGVAPLIDLTGRGSN